MAEETKPGLTDEQLSEKAYREKYGVQLPVAAVGLSIACLTSIIGGSQEAKYAGPMWLCAFSLPPLIIAIVEFWYLHEAVRSRSSSSDQ